MLVRSSGDRVDWLGVTICSIMVFCDWWISSYLSSSWVRCGTGLQLLYFLTVDIHVTWMPTVRKYNSRRSVPQRTNKETASSWNNNEDRNSPITADHRATNSDTWPVWWRLTVSSRNVAVYIVRHSIIFWCMNNKNLFQE